MALQKEKASSSTDTDKRRLLRSRPKFPPELYYDVKKCDFVPEKDKKIPYTPEEDAALMHWMARAYFMFGDEHGKGLTSFFSPCLWHWAEQHKIIQRGWESMKTRCKTNLELFITGTKPIPDILYGHLVEDPLFVFDTITKQLKALNVAEAKKLNKQSAENVKVLGINLKHEFQTLPPAVPARKRSYRKLLIPVNADDLLGEQAEPPSSKRVRLE